MSADVSLGGNEFAEATAVAEPGGRPSSPADGPLPVNSNPEAIPASSAHPEDTRPAGWGSSSQITPDFLLDVRLTVSVEVGRAQMPVRQVMELGPGSVVELQRGASEPVDVFANGRCIGRGEIVVVGEQFGVRITELAQA